MMLGMLNICELSVKVCDICLYVMTIEEKPKVLQFYIYIFYIILTYTVICS